MSEKNQRLRAVKGAAVGSDVRDETKRKVANVLEGVRASQSAVVAVQDRSCARDVLWRLVSDPHEGLVVTAWLPRSKGVTGQSGDGNAVGDVFFGRDIVQRCQA